MHLCCSVLTGLFGCGGGGGLVGCAIIDTCLLYVASQGGVRGRAGEERLVDGRLDGGEWRGGGACQHHP